MTKTDAMKRKIGRALKEARLLAGMTRNEVCRKSQVKFRTLVSWEIGRTFPRSLSDLRRVILVLQSSVDGMAEKLTEILAGR